MSGILDFLFDGQQPTSTTTYGNTTTNVPTWLSDYTQGLIAKGNQIAGQPYQTYEGPRVASLTPDQLAAFGKTRDLVGKYSPMVQQAGALTQAGAAGVTPENIQKFSNPYTENVIKKAEMEANRNYQENILPTLSNTFTASGQYGSSRMAEVASQAARDLTDTLQTNSQAALAQGYNTGADIAGKNAASELVGGQQLGALAQAGQGLDLKDAAALESIGGTQQNQNQANLNTAYQDFQNQTNYNKDQLNWLSQIIRGIQTPSSTTSQQTTQGTTQGASGLSQLSSTIGAIAGLASLFKAKGGAIRFADGGSVYDSPIMDRGDKKYITSGGALNSLTDPVAPTAAMSGPGMTEDWYNTYGEGPEHLFYAPPSGSADITGYASNATPDSPSNSSNGMSLQDLLSDVKNGKRAYDEYQKLFGNDVTSGGFSSVANPTLGETYGLGDATGVGSANTADSLGAGYSDAASPTVGSQFGTGVGQSGLPSSELGALSSIAAPTLGATTGLGAATGVGAANTAAGLGAGYSNAATTLGSQFGTTAASDAAASTAGSAGASAGTGVLGALGTVAPWVAAGFAVSDLANHWLGVDKPGWDQVLKSAGVGFSWPAFGKMPGKKVILDDGTVTTPQRASDLANALLSGDSNQANAVWTAIHSGG